MASTVLTPTNLTGALPGVAVPAAVPLDNVNGNVINSIGPTTVMKITAPAGGGTVTFVTPDNISGHTTSDDVVTFTASQVRWHGPFSPSLYGVNLNLSVSITGFTCEVYQPVVQT